MPYTSYDIAHCHVCGHETAVTTVTWPATRWEPADGESRPEECEECGEEFGEETSYRADEPPDPY